MLVLLLAASVLAVTPQQQHGLQSLSRPLILAEEVERHNAGDHTWTASTDQGRFFENMSLEEAKGLMGVMETPDELRLPEKSSGWKTPFAQLPTSFDSRTHWSRCPSIRHIRDQSACGSCWAFSSSEAMSDRECIANHNNVSLSSQQMNSCCSSCGYGCGGGFPPAAWRYWVSTGLATTDCDPYSLPSCDHHIPNSKNPCPAKEYPTPPCVFGRCSGKGTWKVYKGKSAYEITSGERAIMQEIYEHGPVQTAFTVYSDFPTYKSGVYQHTHGSVLGGHAVKIIGWGVDAQGTKYWTIANSWNKDWGMNGFFNIIRGVNECGIENQISAGEPM